MPDWPSGASPVPSSSPADSASLRTFALVCYVLFLLAVVNGLTAIVGLVLAYVKRGEAGGTPWRSHFDNVVVTFWVMFVFCAIWLLSWPISLGVFWAHGFVWPWAPVLGAPLLIWAIALPVMAIWYFYRLIRGLIHASDGKPY